MALRANTGFNGFNLLMNDAATEADCKETHPGFTITCDRCGSKRVYVENSLGFSAESGGWGSVDLICVDCNQTKEIVQS